jgi:hypothetical protein
LSSIIKADSSRLYTDVYSWCIHNIRRCEIRLHESISWPEWIASSDDSTAIHRQSCICCSRACFLLHSDARWDSEAKCSDDPTVGTFLEGFPVFQPSVTLDQLKRFRKSAQLWRGYTALAARNLPFTAMQFSVFEHLKRLSRIIGRRRSSYGVLDRNCTHHSDQCWEC